MVSWEDDAMDPKLADCRSHGPEARGPDPKEVGGSDDPRCAVGEGGGGRPKLMEGDDLRRVSPRGEKGGDSPRCHCC